MCGKTNIGFQIRPAYKMHSILANPDDSNAELLRQRYAHMPFPHWTLRRSHDTIVSDSDCVELRDVPRAVIWCILLYNSPYNLYAARRTSQSFGEALKAGSASPMYCRIKQQGAILEQEARPHVLQNKQKRRSLPLHLQSWQKEKLTFYRFAAAMETNPTPPPSTPPVRR